jgi:hypothetical protein
LFQELKQLRDPEEPEPSWELLDVVFHEVDDRLALLVLAIL